MAIDTNAVLEAVKSLKKSHFRATAIKVELEAQLNRGNEGWCEYCEEGRVTCDNCCGEGTVDCDLCEGRGQIQDVETGGLISDRMIDCPDCDGRGVRDCDSCEDGRVTCDECGGSFQGSDWGEESYCHDYLMEHLSELGLAEQGNNYYLEEYSTNWHPKGALKYAQFYNDHSVDSEFTFTLSIEHEEDILLLPKIIDIWNDLAEAVGNGQNVSGAGMHMAVINDPECLYPVTRRNAVTERHYHNFRKSMQLLLPALYFLGSPTERSRGLRYRVPQVASEWDSYGGEPKYSAIYYVGGALEFRVFETCYDHPEAILDNIVVISRCLRYWSPTYRPSGLEKITRSVTFGVDYDNSLERFYQTSTHLDLLNAGLQKLKPGYATVRAIKQQRCFNTTKRTLQSQTKKLAVAATREYAEYKDRFEWSLVAKRHHFLANALVECEVAPADLTTFMADIEAKADQYVAAQQASLQDIKQFVDNRLNVLEAKKQGKYALAV
jgi:hypothetical protein